MGKNYKTMPVHRMVAERALGKPLPPGAVVHHVDENKHNNANNNLVICQDRAYHALLHRRLRAYQATGNADSVRCMDCGRWVLPNATHDTCSRRGRRWGFLFLGRSKFDPRKRFRPATPPLDNADKS